MFSHTLNPETPFSLYRHFRLELRVIFQQITRAAHFATVVTRSGSSVMHQLPLLSAENRPELLPRREEFALEITIKAWNCVRTGIYGCRREVSNNERSKGEQMPYNVCIRVLECIAVIDRSCRPMSAFDILGCTLRKGLLTRWHTRHLRSP